MPMAVPYTANLTGVSEGNDGWESTGSGLMPGRELRGKAKDNKDPNRTSQTSNSKPLQDFRPVKSVDSSTHAAALGHIAEVSDAEIMNDGGKEESDGHGHGHGHQNANAAIMIW